MSSKIDGVPRDLLELAAEYLKIHGERSSIEYNTADDIQSLLDAKPQSEPVAHLMLEDTFYGFNGPEVGDFDIQYDHEACDKLAKAFPGQQVALYTAPPELAELQATIARLTAENWRLKGGQGEPVACATCNGSKIIDDGELTSSSGGIPFSNGPIKCVKDCPDCASQPAPVAVLLPSSEDSEKAFWDCKHNGYETFISGWNAYSAKFKELNQ